MYLSTRTVASNMPLDRTAPKADFMYVTFLEAPIVPR